MAVAWLGSVLILFMLRLFWRDVGIKMILEYLIFSGPLLLAVWLGTIFEKRTKSVRKLLILAFGAYIVYFTGERMISGMAIEWYLLPYWVNVLCVLGVMLFLYGVSGSVRGALVGGDAFFLLFSLVNAFLRQVRSGNGLDVIDFYSVGAAMRVAGNYHFKLTRMMAAGIFVNLTLVWALWRWQEREKEKKDFPVRPIGEKMGRAAIRVCCALVSLLFFWTVSFSNILQSRNYLPANSSDRNGLLFNLLLEIPNLVFRAPPGYSADDVEALLVSFEKEPVSTPAEDYPNIIVIMNEAFADFSVFREFDTSEEVLFHIDSLGDEIVRGYTYASIFSGNTATSEYEFLTGDSNILYDTMPYSTLIRSSRPVRGLPGQLKQLGYRTVSLHPFSDRPYRRSLVYPSLGFEEMYFREDLGEKKFVLNGESYISDESNYKKVMELLREKEPGKPLFLFNVTVQNHAPYQGLEETVFLKDLEEGNEINEYFSLLHESDAAFGWLLEELEQYPEKVMVMMFGDHQPGFEKDYMKYLYGKEREEMSQEEKMRKFLCPYYLWANYDIDRERTGQYTSTNYLSLILLERAGIPFTPYQEYLKELRKRYPVISASGIYDAEGNWYPAEQKEELIPEYLQVMYYHMNDDKHSRQELFGYDYGRE